MTKSHEIDFEEKLEELELRLLQSIWTLEEALIELRRQLQDIQIRMTSPEWRNPAE